LFSVFNVSQRKFALRACLHPPQTSVYTPPTQFKIPRNSPATGCSPAPLTFRRIDSPHRAVFFSPVFLAALQTRPCTYLTDGGCQIAVSALEFTLVTAAEEGDRTYCADIETFCLLLVLRSEQHLLFYWQLSPLNHSEIKNIHFLPDPYLVQP